MFIIQGTCSEFCGRNSDNTAKANGLMLSITQFDILITFMVTKKCLAYIKRLSISLQSLSKDICEAFSDINCVHLTLENAQAQVETSHTTFAFRT